MPVHFADNSAAGNVPNQDAVIDTTGGDEAAIGREAYGKYIVCMSVGKGFYLNTQVRLVKRPSSSNGRRNRDFIILNVLFGVSG